MNSSRPLNERMRAFADAWNGDGTGAAAARAAGYAGDDATLRPIASKLLRDSRVRARIVERLGPSVLAPPSPPSDDELDVDVGDDPPEATPTDEPDGLQPGAGRGTATERVVLLMEMARDKSISARERVQALALAAELEGERRVGTVRPRRDRPTAPLLPTVPDPTPPPTDPRQRVLHLVMNPQDRKLEGGDG